MIESGLCRMDLCAATDRDVTNNTFGVVAKTIPAGEAVVDMFLPLR